MKVDNFIKDNFVVCDKCGYNNRKGRFDNFGCCLRCGAILDKKIYFKRQMRKKIKVKR